MYPKMYQKLGGWLPLTKTFVLGGTISCSSNLDILKEFPINLRLSSIIIPPNHIEGMFNVFDPNDP